MSCKYLVGVSLAHIAGKHIDKPYLATIAIANSIGELC